MTLRVTETANELTNELDAVGAEGVVRLLRQVSCHEVLTALTLWIEHTPFNLKMHHLFWNVYFCIELCSFGDCRTIPSVFLAYCSCRLLQQS